MCKILGPLSKSLPSGMYILILHVIKKKLTQRPRGAVAIATFASIVNSAVLSGQTGDFYSTLLCIFSFSALCFFTGANFLLGL